MELEFALATWVCYVGLPCGLLAAAISGRHNAAGTGLILGMALGPIGIVAACFADGRRQCPACNGRVDGKPRLCMHCGSEIEWLGGHGRVREPIIDDRVAGNE